MPRVSLNGSTEPRNILVYWTVYFILFNSLMTSFSVPYVFQTFFIWF